MEWTWTLRKVLCLLQITSDICTCMESHLPFFPFILTYVTDFIPWWTKTNCSEGNWNKTNEMKIYFTPSLSQLTVLELSSVSYFTPSLFHSSGVCISLLELYWYTSGVLKFYLQIINFCLPSKKDLCHDKLSYLLLHPLQSKSSNYLYSFRFTKVPSNFKG